MDRSIVMQLLAAQLSKGGLITDPAGLKPYETDGLTALREVPWAVALPETEAQVRDLLKICARHDVPVVARGAGTGLSGGARPVADGLVLGLSRMKKILSLDPVSATARLQPGVRNLAISEAAAPHGLYYAPDPSSQIACSIGGNVAENAGGVHCLKYGLTVNNVLGLRVLTMDGELLELGGATLDDPGYDLMALLCGSEGMLGVVTEVTVRLLPTPPQRAVLLVAFADLTDAANAVSQIINAGIIPAGLEMMDQLAISAAEDFIHAGYPRDAAAILLCELDGDEVELEESVRLVSDVLVQAGATEVRVATDPQEQQQFWAGRKNAFPAVGRLGPDYYCMDGTIPRAALGKVLTAIANKGAHFGLRVANVFHAGDGNLHPLILYDANVPGELESAEALGDEILRLCVSVGGTVTGEHGVGLEKLNPMCSQFNATELEQFFRVKGAFDPQELLNPGKGIPTLQRCSELGGMHVHDGDVPFKNLPRF